MANKKLFEDLMLGTPEDDDKLAYGKVGSAYKNITYGDLKDLIIAAIPPNPVSVLLTKVFEIGTWNMNDSAGGVDYKMVSVPDSILIQPALIRKINVIIKRDGVEAYSDFLSVQNGTAKTVPLIQIGRLTMTTFITLTRNDGSFYDATEYGNGSTNRGWITIDYINPIS